MVLVGWIYPTRGMYVYPWTLLLVVKDQDQASNTLTLPLHSPCGILRFDARIPMPSKKREIKYNCDS